MGLTQRSLIVQSRCGFAPHRVSGDARLQVLTYGITLNYGTATVQPALFLVLRRPRYRPWCCEVFIYPLPTCSVIRSFHPTPLSPTAYYRQLCHLPAFVDDAALSPTLTSSLLTTRNSPSVSRHGSYQRRTQRRSRRSASDHT